MCVLRSGSDILEGVLIYRFAVRVELESCKFRAGLPIISFLRDFLCQCNGSSIDARSAAGLRARCARIRFARISHSEVSMKFGSAEWWKDRTLLLVVSLILASLAWAFGRAAGEWSSLILGIIVFVALFTENRRLRRELRRLSDGSRRAEH